MTTDRKRALLVWELGDNFGHVAKLVNLCKVLEQRGIDVFVAAQNLTGVAPLVKDTSFTLLQAPYARVRPIQEVGFQVLTYADELLPCGYQRPEELAVLIRAWDGLFDLIKPDILIANSAPTALLAARERDVIKIAMGIGYEVPALSTPMPPLRFWDKANANVLEQHENRVVETINAALHMLGRSPIVALQDMLHTDLNYLTTFPEIDHYPMRQDGIYVGPFYVADKGADIDWSPRQGGRKRIFAYLSHGAHLNAAIQAIRSLPHDIIMVARRLSDEQVKAINAPNLRVLNTAIKIDRLVDGADLCITHGGTSTLVQFLNNGVPQILIPNHIEQLMVTVRLLECGVGAAVTKQASPAEIAQLIEQTLGNKTIHAKAREWAEKYGQYCMEDGLNRIGDDIVTALAKKQQ